MCENTFEKAKKKRKQNAKIFFGNASFEECYESWELRE